MSEQHSSIALAEALEEAGFRRLANRARKHEFHDFLSPHALPQHELVAELREFSEERTGPLIARIMGGDFDATKAEADEWAASPEGEAAMNAIGASRFAPETGVEDANHALLMGHILGSLLRLGGDAQTPTQVEAVRDKGGNYTNRIRIVRKSGEYLVTVQPLEEDPDHPGEQRVRRT